MEADPAGRRSMGSLLENFHSLIANRYLGIDQRVDDQDGSSVAISKACEDHETTYDLSSLCREDTAIDESRFHTLLPSQGEYLVRTHLHVSGSSEPCDNLSDPPARFPGRKFHQPRGVSAYLEIDLGV